MSDTKQPYGLDAPVFTAHEASEPYREVLLKLMSIFVDSQLAAAANFTAIMPSCPSMHDRVTAARVVLEKTDNAEKFIPVMHEFGAATDKYLDQHPWAARRERVESFETARHEKHDMRNPVFDFPLLNWKDAVVWAVLVGHSSNLQIEDFCNMSYHPGAKVFRAIQPVELHHHGLALEEFQKYACEPANKSSLQVSVDYWWPRVSAGFGRDGSKVSQILELFGLRHVSNSDLRARWAEDLTELLAEFGLYPGETVSELPKAPAFQEANNSAA